MSFITPDWPAPSQISAVVTTRENGFSQAPWTSFNLATHVNDNVIDVEKNRQLLIEKANLPNQPQWLNQTHSIDVVDLTQQSTRDADASLSNQLNQVAVVLTADCLPLLICNKSGTEVAAVHAGWKGLLDGIVLKTIAAMKSEADDILVWFGPAISQKNFEVGAEVKQQFCQHYENAQLHFKINEQGKFMADLYALAKDQLNTVGVNAIYGGDFCSYAQHEQFYSYRRDGVTGRMASLIWINSIK